MSLLFVMMMMVARKLLANSVSQYWLLINTSDCRTKEKSSSSMASDIRKVEQNVINILERYPFNCVKINFYILVSKINAIIVLEEMTNEFFLEEEEEKVTGIRR